MALTVAVVQFLNLARPVNAFDALKVLAITTVLYNISLIIYRLTLHPLARYPGRFIDKISAWPVVFDCHSGNRHLRLLEAHKKYGSVVRIGPNFLDFDTETAHTAIHRDRSTNVRKSDWYKLEPAFSGDYSVQTVIDKKEHDFRRRVLQPAFSDSALREQEHFIDDNVQTLLAKLGEDKQDDGWSAPKEFSVLSTWWGFDFISDLAFGSRFNLLGDKTHRYLPDLLKNGSRFIYYAAYLPFAPVWRFLLRSQILNYIPSAGARETHQYFAASEIKLEQRRAAEKSTEKPPRRDIFHHLFRSRDPETGMGFSHEQLMADSGLLIGAGSDGVAVTVAAAVFYLLQNPTCMKTLVQELQSCFTTLDEIRGPKLTRLPYLTGVVHEALRLAPSVPSGLPRAVLPGGLDVDGLHLPADTVVSVSPYCVHHNEDCYPDSYAFRPERWIGTSEQVSLARRSLCTFSAGRFDCAGKNIAVLACKLVLAKLFFAYEVRAAKGGITGGGSHDAGKGRERPDEYQLVDFAVSYRSGPVIQCKERIKEE